MSEKDIDVTVVSEALTMPEVDFAGAGKGAGWIVGVVILRLIKWE